MAYVSGIDIIQLREDVDTNMSDIDGLQTQADENTSSIDILQSQINTNTLNISNLTTTVNTQTSTINTLNTQVSTNTTNITTNTTNISNLQTQTNTNTTSINTLTTQVNTNTTDLATLNTNLSNGIFTTTLTNVSGFVGAPTTAKIIYTRIKNNVICNCYLNPINIGLLTAATCEITLPINRNINFATTSDAPGMGSFSNNVAGITISSKVGTVDKVTVNVGGLSALIGVVNAIMTLTFQYSLS